MVRERNLTRAKIDMVDQDEFHYDFMIELDCGRWLVFGVT